MKSDQENTFEDFVWKMSVILCRYSVLNHKQSAAQKPSTKVYQTFLQVGQGSKN